MLTGRVCRARWQLLDWATARHLHLVDEVVAMWAVEHRVVAVVVEDIEVGAIVDNSARGFKHKNKSRSLDWFIMEEECILWHHTFKQDIHSDEPAARTRVV
jgi:hypothetical protein